MSSALQGQTCVFNKGDRVIALECEFFATNSDVVPAGSVGTVCRVTGCYVIVKFDCHEDSWYTCSGEVAPYVEPAPEPTVKELVDQAIDRVRDVRQAGKGATYEVADLPGGREFSLAITHLEDALMRFTRGMAMRLGVFAPADLEKIGTDPGAASKFLGDRDQKAADAAQAHPPCAWRSGQRVVVIDDTGMDTRPVGVTGTVKGWAINCGSPQLEVTMDETFDGDAGNFSYFFTDPNRSLDVVTLKAPF